MMISSIMFVVLILGGGFIMRKAFPEGSPVLPWIVGYIVGFVVWQYIFGG